MDCGARLGADEGYGTSGFGVRRRIWLEGDGMFRRVRIVEDLQRYKGPRSGMPSKQALKGVEGGLRLVVVVGSARGVLKEVGRGSHGRVRSVQRSGVCDSFGPKIWMVYRLCRQ